MIALPANPAIDIAIEGALTRIRDRASTLGEGFSALGEATARAAQGGKRFRPALVTASFDAFRMSAHPASSAPAGRHASAVLSIAAAFELLHAAFVVHDDVIDRDIERRGVPNVAGEFRQRARRRGADADGEALLGDAAAILAGDLLLHEAFRLVAMCEADDELRGRLFTLLDDAIFVSAAGELADVEQTIGGSVRRTRHDALDVAFRKTAVYSFRAPLQAGALLGDASPDALRVLGSAGGDLGLAFQLVDDLIGAFGTSAQAGRESGVDLREAKRTPLVAIARESGAASEVDTALSLARTGPVAVREAQIVLERTGARDRLESLIGERLGSARTAALDPALPPRAAALLHAIADGIERRIP